MQRALLVTLLLLGAHACVETGGARHDGADGSPRASSGDEAPPPATELRLQSCWGDEMRYVVSSADGVVVWDCTITSIREACRGGERGCASTSPPYECRTEVAGAVTAGVYVLRVEVARRSSEARFVLRGTEQFVEIHARLCPEDDRFRVSEPPTVSIRRVHPAPPELRLDRSAAESLEHDPTYVLTNTGTIPIVGRGVWGNFFGHIESRDPHTGRWRGDFHGPGCLTVAPGEPLMPGERIDTFEPVFLGARLVPIRGARYRYLLWVAPMDEASWDRPELLGTAAAPELPPDPRVEIVDELVVTDELDGDSIGSR